MSDRKISRTLPKGVEATLAAEALSHQGPLGRVAAACAATSASRDGDKLYSRLSRIDEAIPCRNAEGARHMVSG